MGDTEQDGTHEDVICEITKKNTVVEYRPSSRRTSLKIGLFVSIGLNVIFAVLFVVVFIMLSNMNARLSRFDEDLNKEKVKSEQLSNSIKDNFIPPTDSSYNTRPKEPPLVNVLLLYVKSI